VAAPNSTDTSGPDGSGGCPELTELAVGEHDCNPYSRGGADQIDTLAAKGLSIGPARPNR
jgi:hypothetical protein